MSRNNFISCVGGARDDEGDWLAIRGLGFRHLHQSGREMLASELVLLETSARSRPAARELLTVNKRAKERGADYIAAEHARSSWTAQATGEILTDFGHRLNGDQGHCRDREHSKGLRKWTRFRKELKISSVEGIGNWRKIN
jgi:hypothetical protein